MSMCDFLLLLCDDAIHQITIVTALKTIFRESTNELKRELIWELKHVIASSGQGSGSCADSANVAKKRVMTE